MLVEVFGLYETKQGENKPGAEKKKLVVRSPFVWKTRENFKQEEKNCRKY